MSESSGQTWIYANFAGKRRKFQLRLKDIAELERLHNAGFAEIYTALVTLRWRVSHIRETLRLGLMGAGESEADATELMLYNFDDQPVGRYLQIAADICRAACDGVDAGNVDPEQATDQASKDAPATSPVSTK